MWPEPLVHVGRCAAGKSPRRTDVVTVRGAGRAGAGAGSAGSGRRGSLPRRGPKALAGL
ncbi:MAG: hypothetical protein ACLTDR_08510 [Adlercreutzia equolifaciens]